MCSQNITGRSGLDQTDAMLRTASHDNEHAPLGPLDPLNVALQRIRELELELAQTKLAHVEAECKNQDLNHQLNSTLSEIQSSRNSSWQPWLSKTINTIQEKVATRRDAPSFQTYVGSSGSSTIPDGNVINSTPHAAPLQVWIYIYFVNTFCFYKLNVFLDRNLIVIATHPKQVNRDSSLQAAWAKLTTQNTMFPWPNHIRAIASTKWHARPKYLCCYFIIPNIRYFFKVNLFSKQMSRYVIFKTV